MQIYRSILTIAAALGILCTFLPWLEIPFAGPVSTPSAAWLTFLLCGGALAISLVGQRNAPLPSGARIASAICGAVTALVALMTILDISSAQEIRLS